ncbi:MAG: THUMP domain-containing protein [Conexivisphaera sp.]
MDEFNLIFTTYRGGERRALMEMKRFLMEVGDGAPDIEVTGFPGLLLARSTADPFALIDHLYEVVRTEPWRMRAVLRVIPIEATARASVEDIARAVGPLSSKIGAEETYRVEVEKRGSALSGREVIDAVAASIPRKVRLESPDWTVLVEIVEDRAGVSVLRERYIFSSVRAKRDLRV